MLHQPATTHSIQTPVQLCGMEGGAGLTYFIQTHVLDLPLVRGQIQGIMEGRQGTADVTLWTHEADVQDESTQTREASCGDIFTSRR